MYNRVFPALGSQQLRELTNGDCDSLALQAYAELNNTWVESSPADPILSTSDANRFIGFLEGRTRLTSPEWWTQIYAERHSGDLFKYREAALGSTLPVGFLEVRADVDIRLQGGELLIRKGASECTFPATIIDVLKDGDDLFVSRCTAAIHRDDGILAFYDHAAGSCKLFYASKGKLRWQSVAWGQGYPRGAISGGWTHDCEVRIQGDVAAIFGSGTAGPYVEAFDTKTGTNLFRFSREYWLQRDHQ